MLGNLFHTPKTKKFYIPNRYYDPDKAEREAREWRVKEELGITEEKRIDNPNYRPNIKGTFRVSQGLKTNSTDDKRRSNVTRLIIFILILLFVYIFFFRFNFTF
jgi:hypothetical protein